MIILKAYRGWTYTIEYWRSEDLLPHGWIVEAKWSIFDPSQREVQRGTGDCVSICETGAKRSIEWRADAPSSNPHGEFV